MFEVSGLMKFIFNCLKLCPRLGKFLLEPNTARRHCIQTLSAQNRHGIIGKDIRRRLAERSKSSARLTRKHTLPKCTKIFSCLSIDIVDEPRRQLWQLPFRRGILLKREWLLVGNLINQVFNAGCSTDRLSTDGSIRPRLLKFSLQYSEWES